MFVGAPDGHIALLIWMRAWAVYWCQFIHVFRITSTPQVLEPKNQAADYLANEILGAGFLHRSGPARIVYATIRGG